MTPITPIIQAITPAFTGTEVVQQFDRASRIKGFRALRQEMPRVLGGSWNRSELTVERLKVFATDQRFSADARGAAQFLLDNPARLQALQNRSGARGDKRFSVTDLERHNSEVNKQRDELKGKADDVAQQLLEDTTKRLVDSLNSAVSSIASGFQTSSMPSVRID